MSFLAGFGDELVSTILPQGRVLAESRMKSDAIVRRRTGRFIQDEATGIEAAEWTVVHTGKCRVASSAIRGAASSRITGVAGTAFNIANRQVHFPHGSPPFFDGDVVEILSGDATGTVWKIADASGEDQTTARRYMVEEYERPEEWGDA